MKKVRPSRLTSGLPMQPEKIRLDSDLAAQPEKTRLDSDLAIQPEKLRPNSFDLIFFCHTDFLQSCLVRKYLLVSRHAIVFFHLTWGDI